MTIPFREPHSRTPNRASHFAAAARIVAWLVAPALRPAVAGAQTRFFQPADLFRIERAGSVVWAPGGSRATVEISHPGRWLGGAIPTGEIDLVDARAVTIRRLTPASAMFVGFFGAAWAPDGRAVAFLSVDTNAVVRPWVWRGDSRPPVVLPGLQLLDGLADPPRVAWSDDRHVIVMARDSTRANSGPLFVGIQRDRNAADQWKRARVGREAAVIVTDSRDSSTAASPGARLLSVDVNTGRLTTFASGLLHHFELSTDRRTITYRRENPPLGVASAATYLATPGAADDAYLAVDWGTAVLHVDATTGTSVASPRPSTTTEHDTTKPTVRALNDAATGSRLVLARPGMTDTTLWRGNAWVRDVKVGQAEAISYTSTDGRQLTGWVLFPPNHPRGQRLPIVVRGYPGTTYGPRVPAEFSILSDDFEHPQLFAALGYGVVLASMPVSDPMRQASSWSEVTQGVLPLIDTLVARGIADSHRIAFIGQSAGGYAAVALISQTNRFRSAIASAASTNLSSEYGTFYGEYRYGDAGLVQRAQLLRMLQFEHGVLAAPGPPWEHSSWYTANSPLSYAARIQTPLLLVKGEADFIPVQQAEELFTALYRQDKRVRLVRYFGEGHTITARANVLDLWHQFDSWLRETMPP